MRVVVTGGAGFIGANLCAALHRDGVDEVIALDDLSTGSAANLAGSGAKLVEGSILDTELLGEVMADVDAVVHLAARPSVPRSIDDPVASHTINATGTLLVLEAARHAGRPHVIVASSSSVYGANPTLPKSIDLRPQPLSPYAVSKLATEAYALSHARCFELPVLAFRFFNVFGPLQPAGHAYAAAIPSFLDAALAGRPIPIHGDGGQTRDFTYVGSLTSVICDAVARRVTSDDPVNLAFGSRLGLLEVVSMIEQVLERPLEREHGPARAGDVRHSQADQTELRTLFRDIEPTPFLDGLRATVDWFLAEG
ncbi:MAG: NAD-dependent epimerase/dehydratase family protein [Actinomycetota bacterium]